MLRSRALAAATATLLALGMTLGGAGAAVASVSQPELETSGQSTNVPCVERAAQPEILEQTRVEFQRYSWTGGPITEAPTEFPPSANWQKNTANKTGAHADDPVGVPFQRDNPGRGNADWFFWTETTIVVQEYVPAVEAVTCNFEVGLYLYKKLDPSKPASWPNSGEQRFIDSKEGKEWFSSFPSELPQDVCGPGWAVQQDKVSFTGSFEWPSTIEYPDDNIGWPPIYGAKHQDLEDLVGTVPPCEPPTLPNINITASFSDLACEPGSGSLTVALGLAEENGDKLVWTTSVAGNPALPGTVPINDAGVVTVTVDVKDEFAGDYGLNDESGLGVLDPVTGAFTFTFTFTEPEDCVVTVPAVDYVDRCVGDLQLFSAAAALTPESSFTVTGAPNVSYTYTVNGGSPIPIVVADDGRTTIFVTPGDTVVVTAAAADPYSLPEGYEPWQKTFDESDACVDLPPLANWEVSASSTNEVCTPAGSLTSGSITVVFPVGPIENPNPVRYFIAFGTPQQQELTSPVTAVAPGAYVVTAIPRLPADSVGDGGQQVDLPVTVGAWTRDDCELDTLAFTGMSDMAGWLGVLAVLLTVAGMGFVLRRHRVEV